MLFIERTIRTTGTFLLSKSFIFPHFPLRRLFSTVALISRFSRCLGSAVATWSSEGLDIGASSSADGSADLALNRRPVARLGPDDSAALSAAGTGSFPRLLRSLAVAGLGGLTGGVISLYQLIHLAGHSLD